MVAKIAYALAVVLEIVFVPLFLKYSWPKKCWKSFRYKMVCSALFIAAAVCCMFIARNTSAYAKMMLTGLIFGMIGDLFLHLITENQLIFGVGMLSFLIGHVFFIIGFGKALHYAVPHAKVFDFRAILAVIVIVGLFVLYAVKSKMNFGIAAIPCLIYAFVISMMLVTAVQLCWQIFYEGFDNDYSTIFTVGLGALLFVMSDATLAIFLFGGQDKNRPLKIFNILTYFAGQILLGTSILFLKG